MKKILFIAPLISLLLVNCQKTTIDVNKIDLYKTSHRYRGKDGELNLTVNYTYNANNLLESMVTTDYVGEEQSKSNTTRYRYDSHENIIGIAIEYVSKKYDVTNRIIDYDQQNRPLTIYEYVDRGDSKTNLTYETYDYQDKVTEVCLYNIDKYSGQINSLLKKDIYTYDNRHRLSIHIHQVISPYSNLMDDSYQDEYTYDDSNNCNINTKKYSINDDGEKGRLAQEINSTYFKNLYYRPEQVITTKYRKDGTVDSTTTETYTYDDQNRITSYENIKELHDSEYIEYLY